MMMSAAPGHLLGQLIGNLLEDAVKPELQSLADDHGIYLDYKALDSHFEVASGNLVGRSRK